MPKPGLSLLQRIFNAVKTHLSGPKNRWNFKARLTERNLNVHPPRVAIEALHFFVLPSRKSLSHRRGCTVSQRQPGLIQTPSLPRHALLVDCVDAVSQLFHTYGQTYGKVWRGTILWALCRLFGLDIWKYQFSQRWITMENLWGFPYENFRRCSIIHSTNPV